MSALLFYCFTILLFHSRYSTAAADVWGWPPEMQKKFPRTTTYTYYHGLQQNVVFASRTANLACRPSYSTVLLIYYFTPDTVLPRPMFGVGRPRCKKVFHVLPRTTAERSFCISDGQPCMSALLFYCFTVLLFYYFTPDTVLPRPMFGVGPRCKKVFHVLPRGWPSEMQKLCGRCLRLAVRDAKNSAADVCGWPSEMQKTLRPMFAVGRPRCKKLCGRCLRLAVRDAKNSAADVCNWLSEMQKTLRRIGWLSEMQKTLTANIGRRVFCISDSQPQTSAAAFLHLGRPAANIGRRVFASRTANRKHRPQSFCISDGHSCMSAGFFACRPNASHPTRP